MSRADRITALSQQEEVYSDFLTNFNAHPVSGRLLRLTNEKAVSRSIRNLISTNPGDRLYQPDVGSGIRNLLFEPMLQSTAIALRSAIEYTIRTYEPRAVILEVTVVSRELENLYIVTVTYMLINSAEPISVNVTLQRVR
jgi:phage baseplate assembly protein W